MMLQSKCQQKWDKEPFSARDTPLLLVPVTSEVSQEGSRSFGCFSQIGSLVSPAPESVPGRVGPMEELGPMDLG